MHIWNTHSASIVTAFLSVTIAAGTPLLTFNARETHVGLGGTAHAILKATCPEEALYIAPFGEVNPVGETFKFFITRGEALSQRKGKRRLEN